MASEEQPKVLFIASEYEGLVKTGGLADVARALPSELRGACDVRVVLPYYQALMGEPTDTVFPALDVPLTWHDSYGCRIREWQDGPVTVYLVEHHRFYDRPGLYDDGQWPYPDNPVRFGLLSKAALTLCQALEWAPDVVHAHDWQTALVPYYLRVHFRHEPFFARSRAVLNVHNGAYQGRCSSEWAGRIGLDPAHVTADQFEDLGDLNLLKGGIAWADAVVPVSPGYADELLEEPTSHGLWQTFRAHRTKVRGILNGCDYGRWDPVIDPMISANYGPDDRSGKVVCKTDLQRRSGLPERPECPLYGLVSRLTDQKGFHLLIPALKAWLPETDAQVVMIGSGDPKFAAELRRLQADFPERVHFTEGYNDALAHQIEAGSDFFLMPSLFEPCGLNQIYSMKYGTLPIVRLTGGLRDTVEPLQPSFENADTATGFGFVAEDPVELQQTLAFSLRIYRDHPGLIDQAQQTAMRQSFTWAAAAREYLELYRSLMARPPATG